MGEGSDCKRDWGLTEASDEDELCRAAAESIHQLCADGAEGRLVRGEAGTGQTGRTDPHLLQLAQEGRLDGWCAARLIHDETWRTRTWSLGGGRLSGPPLPCATGEHGVVPYKTFVAVRPLTSVSI